jgi:acetoacetate decarboxylase
MSENRWVQDLSTRGGGGGFHPVLPSLEVVYRTDPDALAGVLPPPLGPPPEPRVHARVTDIHLELPGGHVHDEKVGFFAVDAVLGGTLGEYPLLIPIDLEPAIAISRERFGEPKKLADIEISRRDDHVHAGITRGGVTFIEIEGDVVEELPVPEPYPAVQWWFKFMPSVTGRGFDGDPLLVQVDQVRTHTSVERVDGKIELRDLPTCPVVDLPVLEVESIRWTVRTSTHEPRLVGPVDPDAFEPYAYSRYDLGR